ncbi:MAG: hypothetical protein KTR29_14135 [Rhodothermaceae bacterium]|nr:hypothetical protein [Rhodothermaceae bacterium]
MEIILILFLFLLFIIIASQGFALLFAQFGWKKLARLYRTQVLPKGKQFRWVSGSVDSVTYNNLLTVSVLKEGVYLGTVLYFRSGHPSILVPWKDIKDVECERILFWNYHRLVIDRSLAPTILLRGKAGEAVHRAFGERAEDLKQS